KARLVELGNRLQLGAIAPGHYHKIPMPLLDEALEKLRAVVQIQPPVGRTVGARIKMLDERQKGVALWARRRIDMDVRGEPRIGHTEGQGGMKMPGFIEMRTVQDHDIVSSSRNRGCVVSSIIGMYTPSIREASSSISHSHVRVKDVRASLAIS